MATKQLHLNLPEQLYVTLRERAEYEHRSMGAEVTVAVARHLHPERERPELAEAVTD
jgi:plasmid stability protein